MLDVVLHVNKQPQRVLSLYNVDFYIKKAIYAQLDGWGSLKNKINTGTSINLLSMVFVCKKSTFTRQCNRFYNKILAFQIYHLRRSKIKAKALLYYFSLLDDKILGSFVSQM